MCLVLVIGKAGCREGVALWRKTAEGTLRDGFWGGGRGVVVVVVAVLMLTHRYNAVRGTGQAPITLERKTTSGGNQIKT